MDGHAAVAQSAEARKDLLHRGRVELRVGDEVVEEIAVEVQRARLQRNEAIEPGADRLLAAFSQPDVRVADDENLSRGDQVASSSRSTRPNWRWISSLNAQKTTRCSERACARKSTAARM